MLTTLSAVSMYKSEMAERIMKTRRLFLSAMLGNLLGFFIGWIDSRPNWDDTGITVLALLAASFISILAARRKPWIIAILVGIWVPLFNLSLQFNFGSLIAFVPAFAGAYLGILIIKSVSSPRI
jgi:hypothetical protein